MYKIPARCTFTNTLIPALCNKVRGEIVESLSNAQRVALTVVGWTSRAAQSNITATAHHFDDEWNMQNHFLQTSVQQEMQTHLHLKSHMLVHDVSTRWSSSLEMVTCTWEMQPTVSLTTRRLKPRGEALSSLTEEDMTTNDPDPRDHQTSPPKMMSQNLPGRSQPWIRCLGVPSLQEPQRRA